LVLITVTSVIMLLIAGFISVKGADRSVVFFGAQAFLLILFAAISAFLLRRVRNEGESYQSVFEQSPVGMVIFDRETFAVKKVNPKFCKLLHATEAQLLKSDFRSLFPTRSECEYFLEQFAQKKDVSGFEGHLVTEDSNSIRVLFSWSTLPGGGICCTALDITKQRNIEQAEIDTLTRYRQFAENSPTGILLVSNGAIQYANPAFVTFVGFPLAEIIGKDLADFIDPNNYEGYLRFASRISEQPVKIHQGEFRLHTLGGEMRMAGLFARPVYHKGKMAYLVSIVDNSEIDRLSEKIEQDNIRRRGIIITVAHELRTPLQPILGYLNLLIQDPEGFSIVPETKKILERCLVSVDREREIINKMLELSVLESGKLMLNYTAFELDTFVRALVETENYTKQASITIDIPSEIVLSADKDRIYSVLDSILTNAVNFSKPPRTIHIAGKTSEPEHRIELSVTDNGIGISENALDSIFEPFQLADAQKLSRRFDRIGLSLSIAKKIIELHGGEITVTSMLDKGSTFTICLPDKSVLASTKRSAEIQESINA